MTATRQYNRRTVERFELPAMHTSVAVRRRDRGVPSCGHAYDISEAGMRLELDEPLQADEPIEVEIELPNASGRVTAQGRVVWMTDELDDPGPRRIAVEFKAFATKEDRARLVDFLVHGGLPRAA